MKIVVMSCIPAFPTHEGNRSRILSLTRAIRSLGHELCFVVLPTEIINPYDREAHVAEFGAGNFVELSDEKPSPWDPHFLRRAILRLRRKAGHVLRLPGRFYEPLDVSYRQGWTAQLAELHRRTGFDAAMVEYVFHSAALAAFPPGVRKLVDTHDAFTDRHKPYAAKGMTGGYWLSLRAADENRGFRRADTILAIQEQEAATFHRQLGEDPRNPAIVVVNHFLDLSGRPVEDHGPCRALFLGTDNSSNTLSIRAFVDHVLPLVLARLPQFRLALAGNICRAVADHPAIDKLGRVERVIDAFEQAPVLVNPMLVGTGINIKILDGMAAGVPIVSTDTGARGLPDEFRSSVLVVPEQDRQGFADRLIALIGDEALRRELGRKARENAVLWNERQKAGLRTALGA